MTHRKIYRETLERQTERVRNRDIQRQREREREKERGIQ